MVTAPFPAWPPDVPLTLEMPEQSMFDNLAATAARVPDKPAFIYHGQTLTFAALLDQVERLAGYLQADCDVAAGDRVLLYMQNSPQFVIAYYAIMRADAVAVPVNPMSKQAELTYLANDTGARVALCGAELWENIQALRDSGVLDTVIAAAYADMADTSYDLRLPAPLDTIQEPAAATSWRDALKAGRVPAPHTAKHTDLALIPYSSGTTGQPKGCMHTHRSVMATTQGGLLWMPPSKTCAVLGSLPLFHVTGMQNSMNCPIMGGMTVVLMTRWNSAMAAELIKRYRVTRWRSITTMAIDMVNDPNFDSYDLSSLRSIGGGGAAMPAAIAHRLKAMTGLDYIEGYGMSECMAATHINPTHAPRAQCLGVPVMEVDSRVISLEDQTELGPNEPGEIIMHGPQVFQGYWNRPDATADAFINIDGKRFVRSGDIGMYDTDGYFWMVDRLKRMINASGFKVWPAEVEALMHKCPDIKEACVIGAPDKRRGESVKAYVIPNGPDVTAEAIISWCRGQMAAYKCPTSIALVDELPKSGAGKVLWRVLAEAERAATS